MNLRDFLRWWLALLRPTSRTVLQALALPAPAVAVVPAAHQYHSIETLLSLPTVTPDRSVYQRPDLETGEAVELEPRQLTPVWRFDLDEARRLRLANGGDR